MPIPAGVKHLIPIGAEPRILVHFGVNRFSDKGDTFLDVSYDPRVKSVSSINTEWAAGDLGVTSNITIELFDGDHVLLNLSHQIQFELTPCEVYHYFTEEVGKVLIFKGVVVSPIEWNESSKIFTFSVLNKVAGTPVGFAPTRDDIPSIADEGIGQEWPLVFGSPRRSKAILLSRPVIGFLKDATSTLSDYFRVKNGAAFAQNRDTIVDGLVQVATPLELELRVGDEIVRGYFREDIFHVKQNAYTYRQRPEAITNPQTVYHDGWNMDAYANVLPGPNEDFIGIGGSSNKKALKAPKQDVLFIPKTDGQGRDIDVLGMIVYAKNPERTSEVLTWAKVVGIDHDPLYEDHQRLDLDSDLDKLQANQTVFFCARMRKGWMNENENKYVHEIGTAVQVWRSADPDALNTIYVANAFPTISVDAVYSRFMVKDSNSGSSVAQLVRLNPESYEIELAATDLGVNWPGGRQTAIHPCLIKFRRPPTEYMDSIDDPLFCDIESDVPNSSANALEWLLDDWGGLSINHASFGQANEKTRFTASNFTVHEIIDVLELAKDIAWQSRSTLLIRLGEIFMRYLPVANISSLITRPANDFTLEEERCRIVHTDMSELITQYKARYRLTGEIEKEEDYDTLTINNNVDLYGVVEEKVKMFIYDDRNYVQQTLEWWLKQKSVIWKIFMGKAFLDLMEIDPLDYVLIVSNLLPVLLGGSTPGRIDRLSFDAQADAVEFEAWTSIPSGSSNFDPTVLSDTIDTSPDPTTPAELETPLPFTRRVHKDQDQTNRDGKPDTSGRSYVTWGRITDEEPDAEDKYRCLIYERGRTDDMDSDEKSTFVYGDIKRIVPLTVVGSVKPKLDEEILVIVRPNGYFYHQPRPKYL